MAMVAQIRKLSIKIEPEIFGCILFSSVTEGGRKTRDAQRNFSVKKFLPHVEK
jgi:hypothetical protein